MQSYPTIPQTIWEWFLFSKGDKRIGSRSDFFRALPQLSDDLFITLIQAATQLRTGDLRPLASLREEKRKEVRTLIQLREDLGNPTCRTEQKLQYLLWHRGHLLTPRQRMIAREVPCSFREVSRATVADFLVIDETRRAPIIVEVKCGTAQDSLTGVLLELLVQWCFHKSAMAAFRRQLLNDGVHIDGSLIQPEAAVLAPSRFYREALRRSNAKERRSEATHALRLLRVLRSEFSLSVNFIVLSDNWHLQGTQIRCHRFRSSAIEGAKSCAASHS